MIIAMIVFSALVGSTSKYLPLVGLTISAFLLSLMLFYLSAKQYFETLTSVSFSQVVIFTIGVVVNFGWGGYQFKILREEETTSISNTTSSAYYLLFVFFVYPWLVSFYVFFRKWK